MNHIVEEIIKYQEESEDLWEVITMLKEIKFSLKRDENGKISYYQIQDQLQQFFQKICSNCGIDKSSLDNCCAYCEEGFCNRCFSFFLELDIKKDYYCSDKSCWNCLEKIDLLENDY